MTRDYAAILDVVRVDDHNARDVEGIP